MGEYADDYLDYCLDMAERRLDEAYFEIPYYRLPKKKEPHRGLKTGPGDHIPFPKKVNKWSH
jgi:hypothetical protein